MLLAVNHMHEQGMIHRDLKPQNVLLSHDGTPWVADFGLSTSVTGSALSSVATAARGTLAYKAPECFKKQFTPASEVYAFGVVGWELLTAQVPPLLY